RPLGAGPPTPTPDGQCLGRHRLEYALLPGADELDDAELVRAAHDYRYGFLVTSQAANIDPPIAIEGDAVFSCLKGAEDGDGLILRCFNPKAAPASVELAGAFTFSRVRLDETVIEGETAEGQRTDLLPNEIGTFRVRPLPS
ncbi:MAG TPA: glycosyl hydrolase-related protein, partial [Solirubrobacteraceae bacterium]|nr:glycosyl hydrolase-related protein [Solirubrobacteraceae bacterium]